MQSDIKGLLQKIEFLDDELEQANSRATKQKELYDKLVDTIDSSNSNYIEKQTNDEFKKVSESYRNNLAQKDEKIRQFEKQTLELSLQNQEYELEVKKQGVRVERLMLENRNLVDEKENLQREKDAVLTAKDQLNTDFQQTTARLENCKLKKSARKAEVAELRAKDKAMGTPIRISALQDTIKEQESKICELQERKENWMQCDAMRSKMYFLSNQIKESKRAIEVANLDQEHMQAELDRKSVENQSLSIQYSAQLQQHHTNEQSLKLEVKKLIGKLMKAKSKVTGYDDSINQTIRRDSCCRTPTRYRSKSPVELSTETTKHFKSVLRDLDF